MNRLEAARKWFIRTALSYLGTPYIWGGDDPSGFDCSGLVVECLKTVGILGKSEDYTADGLRRLFSKCVVMRPSEGCLLFYLDAHHRARHVVICLDEYYQIGAGGGSAATETIEAAVRQNAFIRIRPVNIVEGGTVVVDPFLKLKNDLPVATGRS